MLEQNVEALAELLLDESLEVVALTFARRLKDLEEKQSGISKQEYAALVKLVESIKNSAPNLYQRW